MMIDYLTFNTELHGIWEMLEHSKDPKVKEARLAIIATMQKYEKRVSDFESDMAPKEDLSTDLVTTTELLNQNA